MKATQETTWDCLNKTLFDFYSQKKLDHYFLRDENYLSVAFKEIEKIWIHNYDKISTINYVMLSEAPLWGERKSYIYNPNIKNTQFFYRSDLEFCLKEKIKNKIEFINKLNSIGFIILDISPFPLNEKDTNINYKEISKKDYRYLLKKTVPIFLALKISLILKKKSRNMKIFYRYGRVRNAFGNILEEFFFKKGINSILR
ncbi:MAG: hypothetical protein NDI81_19720 [Desulfobacula sp.]|nr:hypothetical protein [Desulfobacula sp.]